MNNLIAEFMGYINTTPNDPDFNFMEHESLPMIELLSVKYSSSWDVLMPVIGKLTSELYGQGNTDLDMIWEHWLGNNEQMFLGNHIEEAYRNVVGCIREYNYYKQGPLDWRRCYNCGTNWEGEDILKHFTKEDPERAKERAKSYGYTKEDPEYFMRQVAVEIQGEYDGVSEVHCPECKARFNRFTHKLINNE